MKEYIPGQGSYKVEEAGALTGIGTSYNVDNNWGTLLFDRDDVKIPARGLDLALSSVFNSDHLYSTTITKVSKNDGPSGGFAVSSVVPGSLMTLPFEQANFYRIANGWSWKLPVVLLGKNIFKYAPGDGRVFDLLATITYEAWGGLAGSQGNHTWTEGFEVTYQPEVVAGISAVTIVIPEIQTILTLNVSRTGTSPFDFEPLNADLAVYQADGRVCRFTAGGLLASVTDAAGVNTLTYSYVTEVLEGQIVSSSSRKTFCVQPEHYSDIAPGDLVVVNDEVKVVYSLNNLVTHEISTSSTFDVALPLVGAETDRYKIFKGRLQSIAHTDQRVVKFYYLPSGAGHRLVTVLSTDPAMNNFAAGDLFLGITTVAPDNTLSQYQTCENVTSSARVGDFPTHLAANFGSYVKILQTVSYAYRITNTPSPTTDSIVVTNPAGAPTVYFFQAGGFSSHSWNNAFFHRGMCRRGGTKSVLNIERPDFYIAPGDSVNINRIDDNAFWEASKDNYMRDENAAEFLSDNEFNTNMFLAGQALGAVGLLGSWASTSPLSAITALAGQALSIEQFRHQQRRYARDAAIAKNAGSVSAWVTVASPAQKTSSRLLLEGELTQAPRQNDVFAVVNAIPDKVARIAKTSRNTTRVYVDHTGPSGTPNFKEGDYVFLRTESQIISVADEETFDGGFKQKYIEVEHAFSFLPDENEEVMFVRNDGSKLPKNSQYYCYYLNKPKVVRIELRDSSTEFASQWKFIDYQYSYEINGTTMTDDFDGGGFTEDHTEGPTTKSFEASDIALKSTVVTTGVRSVDEEKDLTKEVFTYQYDEKNFHKGQDSETKMRLDESGTNWLFVSKTVHQLGHPCFNAAYYGTMASFFYEGGNVNLSDGGGQVRKKVDKKFDVYGREIRSRVSSPSLEGRRAVSTFTQWVGSSSQFDDLDPLGVFKDNYLSSNYQALFEAKHALGLVGATIEEVDAQQNTKISYRAFDSALNVLMVHNSIVPSLRTYQDFLSANSPNFTAKTGATVVTDPTKINWSFGDVANSTDWSTAQFNKRSLTAAALTRYTYDPATNNLVSITKPKGNVLNATYGTGWKSSFIVLDSQVLDSNLGGATQYIVTSYDYDVKGRLTQKTVRFKTDTANNDSNLVAWGGSAAKAVTQFAWDGMDRLVTKTVGNGTTQTPAFRRLYVDQGDASWPHPYLVTTDYLGFRTKTFYDSRYREISREKFKPNQNAAGDLDYSASWEVKIASHWNVYDPGLGAVAQSIDYTHPDEATVHSLVTRNTYDSLGRLRRVERKNNDTAYNGDSVFQVMQDVEYDETRNAVVTKTYLGGTADYRQTRVENDWLGRGPVKEMAWTGLNGTGVTRTTVSTYRHDGKLLKKELPNGQRFLYSYDNLGKLEKLTYPDGTRTVLLYDLNQNLVQTINRRNLSTSMTYNQSDREITRTSPDPVRGDSVVTTAHTPFGPATVLYAEGAGTVVESTFEYHWSGGVNLRKQTVDARTLQMAYGYNAAGNRTSMTPTGSGSSPWTRQFDLVAQFHASTPDSDAFNRTAVVDHATGKNVLTTEPDFLGLTKALQYGDYASPAGRLDYGYDQLLRPVTLHSNEATRALDITLTRDFTGNVVRKQEPAWGSVAAIDDAYTYDGMNRLSTGEGEAHAYDELNNLVTRGAARYVYQDPDEAGQDQMRLLRWNDGTDHDYNYDADGNVTQITGRFSALGYDNLQRLRQIVGAQTHQYWYDPSGLRVKKTEDASGTPVTTYTMFEGNNPLLQEVYTASGRQQVAFNLIAGEQILAQYKRVYPSTDTTVYFYLDQLGSRRVVLDTASAVVNRYRYSAWGEVTTDSGTGAYASFTGKDYDATGLIYFNARYYDASTGRFLSEDPARDGTNWYAYCDNNPVNATDPTGMESFDRWAGRNWQTGLGVFLSGVEAAAGAGLTSTGVGATIGIPMVIHGGANVIAGSAKIILTTIEAEKNGSDTADVLSSGLPDSALGMATSFVAGGNRQAAAGADLLDAAIGLALGAGVAKAADEVLSLAKTARTEFGILNSAEAAQVAAGAKKSTVAIVADSIIEVTGQVQTALNIPGLSRLLSDGQ